jgi:translocation and assembly module TamB
VSADGTLAAPDLRGTFNGKDLVFNLASQGVALNQGSFDANFAQNKLLINHFVWHGGAGTISTSGYALLAQQKPKLALDWKAEQFTALSRTDRLLILSGSGKTQLQDDILSVSGDFLVNKGLIEIVGENAPSLSDDVIVIGRSQVIQQAPLQVLLNSLNINLGQDFILRGHGLDALLFGELSLTGLTQYQPHTEGSIQVKRGTFMAYGQLLNIERGILNFNGPTENPGLNIRAMRNTKPVSAGVEITGTAFAPITKLVSTPNVSETEKLSWLVLGHGLDKAGKNQYAMLSLAAGVLFSNNQSVPLQTKIARAAGLDELSFAGSDAESAAVNFGKRLGSDLYLNYEKSVSGLLDVARLTYFITPVWSVRGASGAESAVDVLYTFSFK